MRGCLLIICSSNFLNLPFYCPFRWAKVIFEKVVHFLCWFGIVIWAQFLYRQQAITYSFLFPSVSWNYSRSTLLVNIRWWTITVVFTLTCAFFHQEIVKCNNWVCNQDYFFCICKNWSSKYPKPWCCNTECVLYYSPCPGASIIKNSFILTGCCDLGTASSSDI